MLGTCGIHPMDLLKNRMQMSGEDGRARERETSIQLMASAVRKEGFLVLYSRLSAGLLTQATYTTTRLGNATCLRSSGTYTWLFELLTRDGKPPTLPLRL